LLQFVIGSAGQIGAALGDELPDLGLVGASLLAFGGGPLPFRSTWPAFVIESGERLVEFLQQRSGLRFRGLSLGDCRHERRPLRSQQLAALLEGQSKVFDHFGVP
jgi:hypothetical protein